MLNRVPYNAAPTTKITGQYGLSEIVIISDESGVLVYVWDKWNTAAQPGGAYILEKTKVESVEKAKDLAASWIAQDRNSDIETARRDVEWSEG